MLPTYSSIAKVSERLQALQVFLKMRKPSGLVTFYAILAASLAIATAARNSKSRNVVGSEARLGKFRK